MESPEDARASRREAALASLALSPSEEAERRFREFMNSGGGAFNEWDQRFLDFLARHRGERLLTGTTGGGFYFVFSLRDAEGFWVLAARDGARGKGFLTLHDAERIFDLARDKGLAS